MNTLLTLEVELKGSKVSVVSLSAMEEYHDLFCDLVKNYPESWQFASYCGGLLSGRTFSQGAQGV